MADPTTLRFLIDINGPGGVTGNLVGPENDITTHPVLAGTINFEFRNPAINSLLAGKQHTMEIVEVKPGGHQARTESGVYYMFIRDSAAPGINGEERDGPFGSTPAGNVSNRLILRFRDPLVYLKLKQGIVYELEIAQVPDPQ